MVMVVTREGGKMSEWQSCPVCNGVGSVSGGYFSSDYDSWSSNRTLEPCRVCDGKGIIVKPERSDPRSVGILTFGETGKLEQHIFLCSDTDCHGGCLRH